MIGWRKIIKDDIKRGTVIRLTAMESVYNVCTIIAVNEYKDDSSYVVVARPMAIAEGLFNSKNPMLQAEVFEMTIDRMLSDTSDVEVYQGRDNFVRRMST